MARCKRERRREREREREREDYKGRGNVLTTSKHATTHFQTSMSVKRTMEVALTHAPILKDHLFAVATRDMK